MLQRINVGKRKKKKMEGNGGVKKGKRNAAAFSMESNDDRKRCGGKKLKLEFGGTGEEEKNKKLRLVKRAQTANAKGPLYGKVPWD